MRRLVSGCSAWVGYVHHATEGVSWKQMELIGTFHKPDTIDCYTFVFDELNPGGLNTMLALSEDGHTFSQWTAGRYDPDGSNKHLGRRVTLGDLGHAALDGFFARLSTPDGWEDVWQITHGGEA